MNVKQLILIRRYVCHLTIHIFQAVTVAVFAEGAEAEEAKAAGADIVGGKELIEEIASNELISFSKQFC
jgi:ribosomal protein L1